MNPIPNLPVTIRPAKTEDLPGILEIYNDAVLNTTAVYDETPHTLEQRAAWLTEHQRKGYAVLVAITSEGVVAGWSALNEFRERVGFRFTTENSVYVAPNWRGRGLGKLLLPPLIQAARERQFHCIIAGIDGENEASLKLHARFGFQRAAHLRQAGFKFGRWLDVIYMQLLL